ncbi:cytochrome P450 [Crepidotus variabilis]|uniref:Cytochrome P450 n=1 Tax=Crepidotus variabilis TaxID=179855 RepID=A0A9P6EPP7_9AGAR|nr:cytochrome P450 [Crepidotus variabilis]
MTTFNDVQSKAQEEIDRVVGKERFPTLNDRPSLPYVEALVRETMRWMPVLPLAIPHYTVEDDIYKGYFIPKGTMVLGNTWAISHNTTIYDESDRFDPSRFFNLDGQLNDDDLSYAFGYGRRQCPGRHLASATIWLNMAVILAAFNIRKQKDSLGKDIPLTSGFSVSSIAVRPNPFECLITPRSDAAKALVLERIVYQH